MDIRIIKEQIDELQAPAKEALVMLTDLQEYFEKQAEDVGVDPYMIDNYVRASLAVKSLQEQQGAIQELAKELNG